MSRVMSAHTSLGSHPQYLPHDTFAHTAPMKIPIANRNTAGKSINRLYTINRSASRGTQSAHTPFNRMKANKAYDIMMTDEDGDLYIRINTEGTTHFDGSVDLAAKGSGRRTEQNKKGLFGRLFG